MHFFRCQNDFVVGIVLTHCTSLTSQLVLSISVYYQLMTIPKGAKRIQVEEKGISRNYLALRTTNGKYVLNGGWKIDKAGVYEVAGSEFLYKYGYSSPGSLTSDGPLTEDLVLEVCP